MFLIPHNTVNLYSATGGLSMKISRLSVWIYLVFTFSIYESQGELLHYPKNIDLRNILQVQQCTYWNNSSFENHNTVDLNWLCKPMDLGQRNNQILQIAQTLPHKGFRTDSYTSRKCMGGSCGEGAMCQDGKR